MPLHALSDDERRSHCRREIEALEHWLRRLVHEAFSETYGPAYFDADGEDGNRLFKSQTVRATRERRDRHPLRYPRPIDATTFDELVSAICKSQNYKRHFRDALRAAFPEGGEEARTFLGRIARIRNDLSHTNPITLHDAARAICYSQDVIASLKEYYAAMNEQREYNVPMVIRVADSRGKTGQGAELGDRPARVAVCSFHTTSSGRLYPGDRIAIEVEVDPTFERSSYRLQWACPGNHPKFGDTERVVIEIDETHVQERFHVNCMVISNSVWHRFGNYDDYVRMIYKVLPPRD
jgi:hypothetical protein